MDRNEILKKAQSAVGPDEREDQVHRQTGNLALLILSVVTLILMLINTKHGESNTELLTVLAATWTGQSLYRWYHLRKFRDLALGLVGVLTVILGITGYVRELTGWVPLFLG